MNIAELSKHARKKPKFNYILGGVWQNNTSADVWVRILKIRNDAW